MKHTRTFKIGESCAGGVITVEITGKVIAVIQKEWDTSTGYTKKSSQKNAEELSRGTILSTDPHAEQKILDYLNVITTSYWADTVLAWIKSKVKLKEESMW
jgi:hypothetical protein